MAKFLTGDELNKKVYDIIWEAETLLVVVSPFIKLDEYFKTIFQKHIYNHKLHLLVIFGKNESQPSKSLCKADFDFFKEFKNISIIYCPLLHAKYYANDGEGILTSINLYDHSFKANIEYGVYFPGKLSDLFIDSAEEKALQYTLDVAERHPVVFIKRPVYEKKLLGKNYIESSVLYDATDKLPFTYKWQSERKKFLNEFPVEINANEARIRPEREESESLVTKKPARDFRPKSPDKGFCIRTGKPIPYNLARPMNIESYHLWNQYKNRDFPENFCHETGKPSNGKTSMRNPILR